MLPHAHEHIHAQTPAHSTTLARTHTHTYISIHTSRTRTHGPNVHVHARTHTRTKTHITQAHAHAITDEHIRHTRTRTHTNTNTDAQRLPLDTHAHLKNVLRLPKLAVIKDFWSYETLNLRRLVKLWACFVHHFLKKTCIGCLKHKLDEVFTYAHIFAPRRMNLGSWSAEKSKVRRMSTSWAKQTCFLGKIHTEQKNLGGGAIWLQLIFLKVYGSDDVANVGKRQFSSFDLHRLITALLPMEHGRPSFRAHLAHMRVHGSKGQQNFPPLDL